MTTESTPACLYYDGACSLCRAEVKRLAQISDRLQLQDIHELSPDAAGLPDRRALLERLHYRDAQGNVIAGLSANVAAWQHTRFGFLWRVLEWPLVRPVATRVYDWWAIWRYRRLYGDDQASEG